MGYPKFIVTLKGELRLGMVNRHYELLQPGEKCLGGGYYEFDYLSGRLLLSGASTDFGKPRWEYLDVLRIPECYRGLSVGYAPWGDWREGTVLSERLAVEYI